MTVLCEIAFAVPAEADRTAVGARLAGAFARLPGLKWLDLYAPAASATHDPYVQDGPAPTHLAMLAFSSAEAFEEAAHAAAFPAGLSGLNASTCTAMRLVRSPVAGESSPAPLTAPFSYVVRYHRPTDDEAAFIRHYLDGHPPLLGRLPGIRNVMCYLPLPWQRAAGPAPADYVIGNEVVFTDATAFDAAMASPIRHELRVHYRTLPRFGRNTHFAMDRLRLVRRI